MKGARAAVELNGQRVRQRRPHPAAFTKRPSAAEHEQAAAAHIDELLEQPLLFGRETSGFHAAEDQTAVPEQLGACLGTFPKTAQH